METEQNTKPLGEQIGATTNRIKGTIAIIEPGDVSGVTPEWGRTPTVEKLYGLRRSWLYSLPPGTIKSITLRKPGCKTGVRLWFLPSISKFLHDQLEGI